MIPAEPYDESYENSKYFSISVETKLKIVIGQ